MATLIPLLAFAAILLSGLLALALLMRARNGQAWQEIFRLRQELCELRAEVVLARKDAALAALDGPRRLPLRMPSQNGEDLLLWNYFDQRRSGFFVEVGAFDGTSFSNTYFFEAIGWHGILVEPVPEFHRAAVASRPHSRVIHAAAGERNGTTTLTVADGDRGVGTLSSLTPDLSRIQREGGSVRLIEVPLSTLDAILADVRETIDFVSIDVEGSELSVLRGFDLERFAPRVLVIEDNSGGATASFLIEYLETRGYVARRRVENNLLFARAEDPGQFL